MRLNTKAQTMVTVEELILEVEAMSATLAMLDSALGEGAKNATKQFTDGFTCLQSSAYAAGRQTMDNQSASEEEIELYFQIQANFLNLHLISGLDVRTAKTMEGRGYEKESIALMEASIALTQVLEAKTEDARDQDPWD